MTFKDDFIEYEKQNRGFDTGGKYAVLGLAVCTLFLELVEEMFGLRFTKDFQSALLIVATFAIAYFLAPTGEDPAPVGPFKEENQRIFLDAPPVPEEKEYPRQSNVNIVPKPPTKVIKDIELPEDEEH